ncbi:MAG: MogA/MoaB family molybdenum cofactor biosynthesis protein [Halanaerobiaceae bacterium]
MIRTGVLTLSDKGAAGEREDKSGPLIGELIAGIGGEVEYYRIIPDRKEQLREELEKMAGEMNLDLVLTTGGTGLAPRDVTPDVTHRFIEREVPGIPEAIRAASLEKTPMAMLSRATAGVRGETLIINLPGSPKAVKECLEVVMPVLEHAVELIRGEGGECARE